MSVESAYDQWSEQYDTNANRTRDLEAVALRTMLKDLSFTRCLEIGCGTGKNTEWLITRAEHITAVDLSEGMLAKARKKIASDKVHFIQADILKPWTFREGLCDLVIFSLVLEHIEDLQPVLKQAATSLAPGGHLYIGELHPFKQYMGTKARFETENGTQEVSCFVHHVSGFLHAAESNGLELVHLQEHFDDDPIATPRILSMLFKKGG